MSGKQQPSGVWATDFDAMALKTVLRNLIGKWGPMSVDMQTAFLTDEETVDDVSNDIKDINATETDEAPASDVSELINNNDSSSKNTKKTSSKTSRKAKENSNQEVLDGFEKEIDDDADTNK
ncbi:hypothetical protein FC88_GL001858 [Companilactobacillus futsaii JCM 17355]|nr:hypothetical protein FC88_GL001858 [Companilactobacillus futsaii JCM 17355]